MIAGTYREQSTLASRDEAPAFELRLERFSLPLSPDQLLRGGTEAVLRQTDSAYKNITGELY